MPLTVGRGTVKPRAGDSPMMLADRFRTTAIALLAFVMTVLIRRQIDTFYVPPEILNIINIATVFMMCLVVVVLVRAWLPKFRS
jgi:hypothetical protein